MDGHTLGRPDANIPSFSCLRPAPSPYITLGVATGVPNAVPKSVTNLSTIGDTQREAVYRVLGTSGMEPSNA